MSQWRVSIMNQKTRKGGEKMDEKITASNSELALLVQEVKSVLETARQNVVTQVNAELLNTYWSIGRIICEHEQSSPDRADYGKQTLKELSKALTKEFGKGFSRANLYNMRLFYQVYEKNPDGVWKIELVSLL